MDSLPRREPTRERLRTYSPAVIEDILISSQGSQQFSPLDINTTSWHGGGKHDSLFERIQAQRQAREQELRAKEESFREAMERKKKEAEERREAQFQQTYGEVLEGLSNDTGIMGDTQYTLNHKAKITQNKQQALYTEWKGEVFDKIQGRLQRAVSQRSHRSIERRLQQQMDDYLTTTNKKLGVFRDVIIEDDYNPLTAHAATIRVPTADIRDPLKRDVLKPMYERAMMGTSSSLDSLPLGKQTLDNKMWGKLHIHSTPYGHCTDGTGAYVTRPLSGSAVAARKSRVPFDHYGYPNFDNRAASEEMGRLGKGIPVGPEAARGRKDLGDVLQQTCHLRPEFTGGDLWLEARGKARAPGPEQLRGRGDLTETLHQSSNPYKDGRSLGDQWLEAKGKAKPPGPEQRRGRSDLTEIIMQTSNPYVDGRSLGDQWLEAKGKAAAPGPPGSVGAFINRMDHPPEPPKPKDPRRYQSVIVNDKTVHPR